MVKPIVSYGIHMNAFIVCCPNIANVTWTLFPEFLQRFLATRKCLIGSHYSANFGNIQWQSLSFPSSTKKSMP